MKCPCCGFDFEKKFNPSKKIHSLKSKRSKHTRKLLKQAINNITTNVPSDNSLIKEYYFYQSISNIEDNIVDWTVNWFLEQKPYLKGKGFRYLITMVFNHEKNRDKLQKNEELLIGKPPAKVKFKRRTHAK